MGIDTPDGGRRGYSDDLAKVLNQEARFFALTDHLQVSAGQSGELVAQSPEDGYIYHIRSFTLCELSGYDFKAYLYFNTMGLGYVYVVDTLIYYVPIGSPLFLTGLDTLSANCFNAATVAKTFALNVFVDRYEIPAGWVQRPSANFSIDDDTPAVGQTVHFTDASTNAPTSWYWNFGDGSTSTAQNPSHVYAVAGDYMVVLIASNAGGNDMIPIPITVH